MKVDGKVAKQYARAIFELASAAELDAVKLALDQFNSALQQDTNFYQALTNPAVAMKERVAVAHDVAARLSAPKVVSGFLTQLIENGRVTSLPAVLQVLAKLIDAFKKIQAVEITSASSLSSEEQQAILSQVQKDMGSEARISWAVNPAILGGMQVKAGDFLLDGALSTRLEKMRATLMQ
jgi:F-type H+-transporting ATPase subunit delta